MVVHGAIPVNLAEYLNVAYLDMYTADGGVLSGNELTQSRLDANPLDPAQLEPWEWHGVDITSEIEDTRAGESVHARVRRELANLDADVVFSDHSSGEIADFVAVSSRDDLIEFTLFHCKGSSEPRPGSRVLDVYEVCGQAQKSVPWRSLPRIQRRLAVRLENLVYVRGDSNRLRNLLAEAGRRMQRHQVVVVQPGISATRLSRALSENLGATSDHLAQAGFERLRIVTSD